MIEVETRPAPVETVSPIRPSEAIRLGCLIAPVKHSGNFFGPNQSACALGALALGYGVPFPDVDRLDTDKEYGESSSSAVWDTFGPRLPDSLRPPCNCDARADSAFSTVAHLNDFAGGHQWSRERIADWLAEQGL